VFWPALLMAADLPVPRHLFIHGYLLMDGEKMSKSLGNVLDPFEVMDRFGTDALRYYCLREVGFGQDGSVSTAGFETRYETELANDYGNLASRVIAMVVRYRDGAVPQVALDDAVAAEFAPLPARVGELIDRAELSAALDEIWVRVKRLNRYVEEQAPWTLAKDDSRAGDLDRVLASLVEGVRVVTVLLTPYLPETSEKLLAALGAPDHAIERAAFGAGDLPARVEKLAPLFPKDR
jgi:methionyl-tRNA synthetase